MVSEHKTMIVSSEQFLCDCLFSMTGFALVVRESPLVNSDLDPQKVDVWACIVLQKSSQANRTPKRTGK